MLKWCGILGLLVWLGATAASIVATNSGIQTTRIELQLENGSRIYGVLYQDFKAKAKAPAALVLHGTALSHSSMAPAVAIPLARSGFVVLAIDLRGHGRSSGEVAHDEYGDLHALMSQCPDQPEVQAGIDYLRAQPNVDPHRVALVGCSRGGWMAAIAGAHDKDVACVVAVSSAPTFCDLQKPRNLLFLAAGMDCIIPPSEYQLAFSRATGGEGKMGQFFGDLPLGTARQIFLSGWSMHLSALGEPVTTERVVQWAALSTAQHLDFVPKNALWITVAAVGLASLGGMAAAAWLTVVLAQWLLPRPDPKHHGPTAAFARSRFWCWAAVLLIAMLPVAPLAVWVGDHLPDQGLLFSSQAVGLLGAAGLFALLTGLTMQFAEPAVKSLLSASSAWRGLGLGTSLCLLELSLFGLTWGTTWVDFSITPRRIVCAGALLLIFFPACWFMALGVQKTLGQTNARRGGALPRCLVWLGLGLVLWLGHICFVRQHHPFAGIPLMFVVTSSLVPLPLWLLSDRPGLCTARAVNHALATACFLACHLPFVAPG
jgi:dienelactone hydrolase